MPSSNFFLDNKDISFHVEKRIDFEKLFSLILEDEKEAFSAKTAEEYKRNCQETLQAFGEICATEIAPYSREVDETPLKLQNGEVVLPDRLKKNIATLKSFGMTSLSIPPRYSGIGGPFLMEMIACEMLNRACPSTMLNCAWHGPIARILIHYADKSIQDLYVEDLVSGKISGNMALTEAGAGSDLSAIRTKARKDESSAEKVYLLTGEKKFITNGGSELSLVLAKGANDKKGLSSLSLYLCPRKWDGKDNFKITNLEKKIALNGSATCELVYENSKAYLLGEDGEGYRYMLDLMNDSRIGVSFQSLGVLEGIYQDTLAYAEERTSWGKSLLKHELIAEKLLDQRANLTAVRSVAYKMAFYRSLVYYLEEKLQNENLSDSDRENLEKEKKKISLKLRYYTPLLKYKMAEDCVKKAREGVQILGGYGFTKEYTAEWRLRESLIYPIYEGTSQIQALMSMKDTIKQVIKNPTNIVGDLLTRTYLSFLDRSPAHRKLHKMIQIEKKAIVKILTRLVSVNMTAKISETASSDWFKVIQHLKQNLSDFSNLSPALLNAERLCEIKGLIACARSLLEDIQYDASREVITNRFLNTSYLKVKSLYMEISYVDPILSDFLSSEKYTSSDNPLL